jgi:hypothetical protein
MANAAEIPRTAVSSCIVAPKIAIDEFLIAV